QRRPLSAGDDVGAAPRAGDAARRLGRRPGVEGEIGAIVEGPALARGLSMLARVTLAVILAAAPLFAQQEEKPKVPKDSLLATITGCLKGRVIRASDVRQRDTTSGYTIRSHSFRVNGKKDLIGVVKDNDGRTVEITGLIKKSALIEPRIRSKG